jgi:hypothetical protein
MFEIRDVYEVGYTSIVMRLVVTELADIIEEISGSHGE